MRNAIRFANVQDEVADQHTPTMEAEPETGVSTSVKIKQMGSCMVCGSGLGRRDDVVWCRHCGSLAHRIHLLEWIQTKKCCPACGGRLDEREYRARALVVASTHSRKAAVGMMPRRSQGLSGLTVPGVLAVIGLALLVWGILAGAVLILMVIAALLIVPFIIIWFIASLGSPGSLGQRGQ